MDVVMTTCQGRGEEQPKHCVWNWKNRRSSTGTSLMPSGLMGIWVIWREEEMPSLSAGNAESIPIDIPSKAHTEFVSEGQDPLGGVWRKDQNTNT